MGFRDYRSDKRLIRQRRNDHRHQNWQSLAKACIDAGHVVSDETLKKAGEGKEVSQDTLAAIAAALGGHWTDYLDLSPDQPQDQFAANNARARREHESQSARTLVSCAEEMIHWDLHQPPERAEFPLEVATLAIDLANGWVMIETAINHAASATINFRILILTSDGAKLPQDVPREVRAWSHSGVENCRVLADRFAEYKGPKQVSIEIREYAETPTIHGIRSSKGSDALYVITECTLKPGPLPVYDFGEGQYRMFREDGAGEAMLQLRDRYNARFEQLWRSGESSLRLTHPPIS